MEENDTTATVLDPCDNDEENIALEDTHVTSYRWVILFIYVLTWFCQTVAWLGVFSVSEAGAQFFNVSEQVR